MKHLHPAQSALPSAAACRGRRPPTLASFAVALLCAGGAHAQDAITVYGVIDMAIVREAGGKDGAVTKLSSGVPMGSRIGVSGSETLDHGLKALFVLENGFQADTGEVGQGGVVFGRQAWVGLQGGFGSVLVGRQYTPEYQTVAMADPFGSGYIGDSKNMMATSGNAFSRMDNTVKYLSPTVDGISVELAAAPGETSAGGSSGRQRGAAVDVRRGKLRVRIGYHDRDNDDATRSGTVNGRNLVVGAVHDLGSVKLYGAYGRNRGLNSSVWRNNGNPYGRLAAPVASLDSRDAMLGVQLPFGLHALMASIIHKDDRGPRNQDARQLAIGYRYGLSKRTDLYAVYARIDNRNDASYTLGNASENGSGDRATCLGLRHAF